MGKVTKNLMLNLAGKAKFQRHNRPCRDNSGNPTGPTIPIDLKPKLHMRPPSSALTIRDPKDIENFKNALFTLVMHAAEKALDEATEIAEFKLNFKFTKDTAHSCQPIPSSKYVMHPLIGKKFLQRKAGGTQIDTVIKIEHETSPGVVEDYSSDPYISNMYAHLEWGQVALACG